MTTNKLKTPIACAIMYKNHFASFGFSLDNLITLLELKTIDSFFDILVCKYDDHIEYMIHVSKTDDEVVKIHRVTVFHKMIQKMHSVSYESLTNSYVIGKEYDCLTAKCMLHAVNK
ncbi:hypothetical protein H2O64_04840 [Kordia sp. YSTF-M3]|uniref:Uncharacterized protein n=1 Tax=Kordia aestuariivivens TaxID=2759037 RepID=A0ABR7Q5Z2_9FLAO|nr:hypothetical protein [Kordia aestuariivivens]MBC8753986.1 hypothetical protein [Kordia aestuariivivens]